MDFRVVDGTIELDAEVAANVFAFITVNLLPS
jgi:hypothetical protein